MQILSGAVGVEQGESIIFTDFKDNGEMWSGEGDRIRRHAVKFAKRFRDPPAVTIGLSMWDIHKSANSRVDISARNITETGFDIVFHTWEDTKVARARVNWLAVGSVNDEHWDELY